MKKTKIKANLLEKIPVRNSEIDFKTDENGIITLEIENKGIFNRIAQKLLKKPKISYIHLDEMGSFIWNIIDGHSSILTLGDKVKEHFGEKAEPLYERLAKYCQILESYRFIELK